MQQDWNDTLGGIADANQKLIDAATELARITVRTRGRLARRQLAAFEDCLEAGSKHLHVATETSAPQEALRRHFEVNAELRDKLLGATKESIEIQAQARDALMRWLDDSVSTAGAEVQSIASEVEEAVKPPAPARKPGRTASRKSA